MTDITTKLEEDPVYVRLKSMGENQAAKIVLGEKADCFSLGDVVNAKSIINNANYYQSLILNGKIKEEDYNFLKNSSQEEVISRLHGN